MLNSPDPSRAELLPPPASVPLSMLFLNQNPNQNIRNGVPAMAQWVRNPAGVAGFAVEARVRSAAWHSGLKEPMLLQLWLGFSRRPWNFHAPQVWPLKPTNQPTSNHALLATLCQPSPPSLQAHTHHPSTRPSQIPILESIPPNPCPPPGGASSKAYMASPLFSPALRSVRTVHKPISLRSELRLREAE